MSKQLDIEVECHAEARYARDHENRSPFVPWARRCGTVKDAYRAAARRALMQARLIPVDQAPCG